MCFLATLSRHYGKGRLVTYVVASEVVNGGLGQHAVVLELTLAERRSVASNDDQLGLAGTKALEGRLVTKSDCEEMLVVFWRDNRGWIDCVPLPDFITSANLELMLLASFLLFLTGAILSIVCELRGDG